MNLSADVFQFLEAAKRRYLVTTKPDGFSIREWLLRGGDYSVVNVSPSSIEVQAIGDSWSRANGTDTFKFFWAARDSIIPKSDPIIDERSLSWATIAAYYSKFFLMLGFLRLFGYGLLYFTDEDASHVTAALGWSHQLRRGIYSFRIILGPPDTICFSKMATRGFHETFWHYADKCLVEISDDIGNGRHIYRAFSPALRTKAVLEIDSFKDWLGSNRLFARKVGWMSELRNEINYRLLKRVWSPNFRRNSVTTKRLQADMQAVIRGRQEDFGANINIDVDVRELLRRACLLYRELSKLSDFPGI